MGMRLYKWVDGKQFGNKMLVEFLEQHGAQMEQKTVLEVTVGFLKAAINNPEEAGITDEDRAFLIQELAALNITNLEPYEDEDEVDWYDVEA